MFFTTTTNLFQFEFKASAVLPASSTAGQQPDSGSTVSKATANSQHLAEAHQSLLNEMMYFDRF